MKKLVIIFGLFAFPVMAMELIVLDTLTTEQTSNFVKHFSMAVGACKRKVADKIYSENNSICAILCKLSDDLSKHDNDIKEMLRADKFLLGAINSYRLVDSNPVIQRALDQIRKNEGDVKKARDLVIQNRRVLAELKLQEYQPTYSLSLIGEIDTRERENFVHRNENYPMTDGAIIGYMGAFIYLTLLADKID